MKIKYISRIVLILAVILVIVTGCSQNIEPPTESKTVLKLAGGDTGVPNPFLHQTRGPGMSKMQLLYDSLLEIDENGYIPWLAASYSIDESGRVYTFELVDHAVWHDGEPLTVEDVLFTFDYIERHKPVRDLLTVNGESIIEKIASNGDSSFSITVKEASNTILASLGGVRILPKHIWASVEDPLNFTGDGSTVGSGPYKLDHYDAVKGEYRYVAFGDYWGLKPAVDAIEWVPVGDSVLAFENKEIDLINIPADLVSRYSENPDFTVKTLPSYHAYRLVMNIESVDAFKNRSLRQALAYAIDRQGLVDKIARGNGEISPMGYIPETSKWYNPEIESYETDVQKSIALLENQTFTFKILIGNAPVEAKIAELIKLNLQEVGITLEIESVESKVRDQALKNGHYEILLINTGGMGGDPDYMRSIYGTLSDTGKPVHSTTIKGYENPEVIELATQQAVELDEGKRGKLLDELQELVAYDVPMIMLMTINDNFVYRHDYYDGWYARFDHSKLDHNKLSYVER